MATIFVCIRRCLLIQQLDREHRQLYELEMGLADAPEVHATPYIDVDCYVTVIHSTGLDGGPDSALDGGGAVRGGDGGESGEGKCDETHPLSGGSGRSGTAGPHQPDTPLTAGDVLIDMAGKTTTTGGPKPLVALHCEPFFDGLRR